MRYVNALRSLFKSRLAVNQPTWKLDRTVTLLERLKNPQSNLCVLQVAGTNGKGSTCAFLAAMLKEGSVQYGCFTSPHLSCTRERISLNGQMISENLFCELHSTVHEASQSMNDMPTFFEQLLAMALLGFAQQHLQVAILEVGLGGRLDATTAVTPQACGITSIALDHQRILGNTLSSIAQEKAGIMKRGVPVVTATQHPEARTVIRHHANALHAPLQQVGCELQVLQQGRRIAIHHGKETVLPLVCPALQGPHQKINAAVAAGMLHAAKLVPDLQARKRGVQLASWPARYEWIKARKIHILLDGAHNAAALTQLGQCLQQDPLLADTPLIALVGLSQGHNPQACVHVWKQHMPPTSLVLTTQAKGPLPRNLPAHETARLLRNAHVEHVHAVPHIPTALATALKLAKRQNAHILITGSLHVAGHARAILLNMPVDAVIS